MYLNIAQYRCYRDELLIGHAACYDHLATHTGSVMIMVMISSMDTSLECHHSKSLFSHRSHQRTHGRFPLQLPPGSACLRARRSGSRSAKALRRTQSIGSYD